MNVHACFPAFAMTLIAMTLNADDPELKIEIDASSNSAYTNHRIGSDGYVVDISVAQNLVGRRSAKVRVKSRERGVWKNLKMQVGKSLNVLQRQKVESTLGVKPALRQSMDFVVELRLKQTYRHEDVQKEVDDLIAKFTKQAEKEADLENKTRKLEGRARERFINDTINELGDRELRDRRFNLEDTNFQAVGTSPAFIIDQKEPADVKLRNFIDWLALNRIYPALGVQHNPDFTPERELKRGREILTLVFGTAPDRASNFLLVKEPEQFTILDTLSFSIETAFEPGEQPDSGWQQAQQVGFASGDVSGVNWTGAVRELQAKQPASAWLALMTDTPWNELKVRPLTKNQKLHWNFVRGRKGWSYLRVIHPDQPFPFGFEVSDPKASGDIVKLEDTSTDVVRLPY